MPATERLAAFAAALTFGAIPAEVVAHAKTAILDGIGVCLHGAALPWTRLVQRYVAAEGGQGRAPVWGTATRTTWSLSVLANGTAGHAFEMDDIHKDSVLHPNSLTVPIALGYAAEHPETTGEDVLAAIVAGYEVGTRVGNAATTQLFLNGFHPQGTTGVFAAAATAGHLLRLDAKTMQHALGIAGSLAAGLMAAQEGAMVKRLHAGHAAETGVRAALLARSGFTGIEDVVEAPYGGFLSALSRTPDLTRATQGLGTEWETLRCGYKLYPSVTSIHAALDALADLMREHHLTAAQMEKIEVGVGHMTYVHTAWPYRPAGVTAAQMNMFYGLAALANHGHLTVEDFAESHLADPVLLAFMSRITVHEDEAINAAGPPARHACRMTLTTKDGATHDKAVTDRRGSPENPVSPRVIEEKFRANVRACLPDAERPIRLVGELDTAPLDDLLTILASAEA